MLRLHRRALYLLPAVLAVFLLLLIPKVQAAATFNLTTSPLPILLATKPGQTVTTQLRVQNSGTETVNLKVTLKKFSADGSTGKPRLADRGSNDDYFGWVSFSPARFKAEPGVWHDVTMTIKVPADAGFGYYYAPIFSIDTSPDEPLGNASQLQGATAVLVLLDVQVPGEKRQLGVDSFSASKKLYEYLPASFDIKIRNSGDIHLRPSGTIFISKGKNTVATLDINSGGGNILPNSTRNFSVEWTDGFPAYEIKRDHGQIINDKQGKPLYQLRWDLSKANRFRFGHYTAHLLMTYDNGSRDVPVEAETSFWVLPWKILPIIIIILALICVGLFVSGRSLWRRFR